MKIEKLLPVQALYILHFSIFAFQLNSAGRYDYDWQGLFGQFLQLRDLVGHNLATATTLDLSICPFLSYRLEYFR